MYNGFARAIVSQRVDFHESPGGLYLNKFLYIEIPNASLSSNLTFYLRHDENPIEN